MEDPKLLELRAALLSQDSYERFQQLLQLSEPFTPTYRRQWSSQHSTGLLAHGGRYTT